MPWKRTILACLCAVAIAQFAIAAPKPVRIEAETAQKTPGARVVQRADASGGACLEIGLKKGERFEKPDLHSPDAELLIPIPETGHYRVTMALLAPSSGSDSFHYSFGRGGKYGTRFMKGTGKWGAYSLFSGYLKAGEQVVTFYQREAGVLVDYVEVRKVDAPKVDASKYKMPDIVPPSEHPRLLVRKSDLPTIRARLKKSPNSEAWEIVKRATAAYDSGKLGKKKVGRAGNWNGRLLRTIRCKAGLYLIDGNEAEGRKAVEMALDFLRTVDFLKSQDVTRPMGETIYTGSIVYDWCHALISDEQKKEMIKYFEVIAGQMEIGYPPYRQTSTTGHGGEAQLMRDLLSAGIATYDEYPVLYQMTAGRFLSEFIEPRNFQYPSGRHHEGDSYGPYRYAWEVFSSWLFKRMVGIDVYDKTQGDVLHGYLYLRRPDGQMMRDGDTFLSGQYWSYARPMFMAGTYYKDSRLIGELMKENYQSVMKNQPMLWVLLFDPDVKPMPHNDLPLTRYRGGTVASMIVRTGWNLGLRSTAAVVELKGAGYHFNNHRHLDAGSFEIYYRGALAAEPGGYGRYGTEYDFGYNKRSISHNVMLVYDPNEKSKRDVNDGGQRFPQNGNAPRLFEDMIGKDYKTGDILAHDFGPNDMAPWYSYMEIELARAYTKKVEAYTRAFCFVRFDEPGRPGALVVRDRIRSANPDFKKTWLLHTLEKPDIMGTRLDARRVVDGYSGRLVADFVEPKNPEVRVIDESGEYVDVHGRKIQKTTSQVETRSWRTEVSPPKAAKDDTFLNVLQIMNATGVEPYDVTEIGNGVAIGPRAVLFADGADRLKATIPSGVRQVVVVGLKPGDYAALGHAHQVAKESTTIFLPVEGGEALDIAPLGGRKLPAAPDLSTMRPKPEKPSASTVIVDEKAIEFAKAFEQAGDDVLVPVAPVFKALGVKFALKGGAYTARLGDRKLAGRVGEKTFTVNGRESTMRAPADVKDGELRLCAQAIGSLIRMRPVRHTKIGDVVFSRPTGSASAYWVENVRVIGAKSLRAPTMALDGNLATNWACNSDKAILEMDLGKPVPVSRVAIAWYVGSRRKGFYALQTSVDGKEFDTVFDGMSSGKTDDFQTVEFPERKARFVRLIGKGNSESAWNTINEIRILKPE